MSVAIEIDPIRCDAHGLCAELLPERITLDDWGYPLVDGAPLEGALEELARRAASVCPTLAIKLRAAPHGRSHELSGSARPGVEQWDQRGRQHQPER
jgi:ferredoxin